MYCFLISPNINEQSKISLLLCHLFVFNISFLCMMTRQLIFKSEIFCLIEETWLSLPKHVIVDSLCLFDIFSKIINLNFTSLECTLSKYSEVPNRGACSLRFFRFSFHPARNLSCNKRKISPCSFINLLT